jgi:hypothetical protein
MLESQLKVLFGIFEFQPTEADQIAREGASPLAFDI